MPLGDRADRKIGSTGLRCALSMADALVELLGGGDPGVNVLPECSLQPHGEVLLLSPLEVMCIRSHEPL